MKERDPKTVPVVGCDNVITPVLELTLLTVVIQRVLRGMRWCYCLRAGSRYPVGGISMILVRLMEGVVVGHVAITVGHMCIIYLRHMSPVRIRWRLYTMCIK